MSDMESTIAQNIQKYGWHAQCVFGGEGWPEFAYSIGWARNRGWPELLVIGQRAEVAHAMLNRFWGSDQTPAANTDRSDILDGFTCRLIEVDVSWYPFLFGAALDYYIDNNLRPFRALQCVWPTTTGIMPWDSDAPQGFDCDQPLTHLNMNTRFKS